MCTFLEWSRCSDKLAIVQEHSSSLIIWDAETGKQDVVDLASFRCGRDVAYLTWSRDSDILAIGFLRNAVVVYDLGQKQGHVTHLSTGGQHNRGSNAAQHRIVAGDWRPGGSCLALANDDQQLIFLSDSGDICNRIRLRGRVESMSFGDGQSRRALLAINVNRRSLLLHNTAVAEKAVELAFLSEYGDIVSHAWATNNRLLLAFSGGYFIVMSTAPGQVVRELACVELPLDGEVCAMAYSSSAERAAVATRMHVLVVDTARCAVIWDRVPQIPDQAQGNVDGVAWSGDGSVVSVSEANGTIYNYHLTASTNAVPFKNSAVLMFLMRPVGAGQLICTMLAATFLVMFITARALDASLGQFAAAVLGTGDIL